MVNVSVDKIKDPSDSEEADTSRVRLGGLAVVASDLGDIPRPELPEGYTYEPIQTTGSRPWGLILSVDDELGGNWREVLAALPDDRYLFHQLTVCVPGDSRTIRLIHDTLNEMFIAQSLYDNFSVLVQGRRQDQVSITALHSHLTNGQAEWLLGWVEDQISQPDTATHDV